MTLAILCSGQGHQHPAMFELTATAPAAAPVFAAAASLLDGRDPRDLVRQADPAALHRNRLGQILCVTQALAAWEVLRPALNGPVIAAGYSVGELAAWGCVGMLPIATVLDLTMRRAACVDAVEAAQDTGLAGIRGLPLGMIELLAGRYAAAIAIVNADDSAVVGGPRWALGELCAAALAFGAHRAVPLAVAVASHTPVLAPASRSFAEVLTAVNVSPPQTDCRVLSGLDGTVVRDLAVGRDKLALQLSTPLRWDLCLETCRERGVTRVLELGPGHALATMAERALPGVEVRPLEAFWTVPGLHRFVDPAPASA